MLTTACTPQTEYAFGLFANLALNPEAFSLLGVPVSYKIIHFAANQNIVSLALIIDFNITALGVVSPVEVDFWATFNDNDQISQVRALAISHVELALTSLTSTVRCNLPLPPVAIRLALRSRPCPSRSWLCCSGQGSRPSEARGVDLHHCHGQLQGRASAIRVSRIRKCLRPDLAVPYANMKQCFDFMYEEVPLGEAHQLG